MAHWSVHRHVYHEVMNAIQMARCRFYHCRHHLGDIGKLQHSRLGGEAVGLSQQLPLEEAEDVNKMTDDKHGCSSLSINK